MYKLAQGGFPVGGGGRGVGIRRNLKESEMKDKQTMGIRARSVQLPCTKASLDGPMPCPYRPVPRGVHDRLSLVSEGVFPGT